MVTTSFKTGYFFHNETNNLCLKNQNQHQFVRGYSYPLEAGYIHKNGNKKFSVFYKMYSQNIRGSEQLRIGIKYKWGIYNNLLKGEQNDKDSNL